MKGPTSQHSIPRFASATAGREPGARCLATHHAARAHRFTPAIRRTVVLIAMATVLVLPSAADALEVWVNAPDTAASDTLIATFGLRGILDPEEENPTVGEGIPATLTIVVDLWRDRSGWWDSLVRSRTYAYRFRRDVWSGVYAVINPDGSEVTLADPPSLRAYLERVHEIPLGLSDRFDAGKHYYLTVKAVLEPLDLDDLEEVEAWLNGDVTGGPAKGGLLGVPKALYRLAVDLSGLGTESRVGRSEPFEPRP